MTTTWLFGLVLAAQSPAWAQNEQDYLEISFTGDGKTPSALGMFEARERAPKKADYGASSSAKGDASFSIPIALPPAHLSPAVSLAYSSASGAHSWVGKGWSIEAGPTITRVTGRAAEGAYRGVETYRVAGGGFDGVLLPGPLGWEYDSTSSDPVFAERVGDVWTLERGGIVTELETADIGTSAVHWHAARQEDRLGNEVVYDWDGNLLNRISYGGTATTPLFGNVGAAGQAAHVSVQFTYTFDPPYPVSYEARAGGIDVIDGRLTTITVQTDPNDVPRVSHVLDYGLFSGEWMLAAVDELDVAEGYVRNVATMDYTAYDGDAHWLESEASNLNAAPEHLSVSTSNQSGGALPHTNQVWTGVLDVTGDGLADSLELSSGGAYVGWFLWSLGQGWEDAYTAGRDFALPGPGLGDALESDLNVAIGEIPWSLPALSEYAWATYSQQRLIDLDGDGFLDLLVTDDPLAEWPDVAAAWDTNLAVGAFTWEVYPGSASGLSIVAEELQAPFITSKVTRQPYFPEGRKGDSGMYQQPWDNHGAVLDLMDLNGDGFLDILLVEQQLTPDGDVEGGDLKVWYRDPEGDWLSGDAAIPESSLSMASALTSLETQRATIAPTFLDYSIYTGVHEQYYKIDSLESQRGFRDLNGDGFVDFVDASVWSESQVPEPHWDVWLGNGEGFEAEAVEWPAPFDYYGRSDEGEPSVRSCAASDPSAPAFVTPEQLTPTEVPLPILPSPLEIVDGCSESSWEPQRITVALLEMDGDGRLDLVDFEAREWWRNTGSSFEVAPGCQGHSGIFGCTPSWFPDALSQSWSRQLVSTPLESAYDGNLPWSQQVTGATTATTYQHWQVGDYDQNGLPDLLVVADEAEDVLWDRGATWSVGPRPGLLSSIVRGHGAETAITYVSSASVAPSGADDGRPHEMATHRELVAEIRVEDPHTDIAGRQAFAYDEGVCKGGVCRGFRYVTTESHRYDPVFAPSLADERVLVTDTQYMLGRDWVLPKSVVHQIDWNAHWTGEARALVQLWHPRYELEYTYSQHHLRRVGDLPCLNGGALDDRPQQCWLDTRTTTEWGFGGGVWDERSFESSLEYSLAGNVVAVRHADLGGPQDDVDVLIEYESDATGRYYRPSSFVTESWDSDLGVMVRVEEGRFGYDGNVWNGGLSEGLLTAQQVCSGFPGAGICDEQLDWQFTWFSDLLHRGALETMTGPAGAATYTLGLDFGALLPTTTHNALLHDSDYTYDALGRETAASDPNGVTARKESDAFGRPLVEYKSGRGATGEYETVRYLYHDDAAPRYVELTRSSYAAGSQAPTSSYSEFQILDGFGRVFQTWRRNATNDGWIVQESVRDLAGDVHHTSYPHTESVFDTSARSTTIQAGTLRDAFGDVWLSWEDHFANDGKQVVSYPAAGVVSSLDADGRQRELHHDTHGRLAAVWQKGGVQPWRLTGEYVRDGRGRVTAFTDGDGNTYTYQYDGAGRLRQVFRQGWNGVSPQPYYAYVYDGPYVVEMFEGDLATGTSVVTWTYDDLGRTLTKTATDPAGGTDTYGWLWDEDDLGEPVWIGARWKVTDPMGEVEYAYADGPWGGFGDVTATTRRWAVPHADTVLERAYDFEGNTITATWPSGAIVDATFGPTNWLESQLVTWDQGTIQRSAEVFQTYDTWGLHSGWYGGEGVWNYDAALTRSTPTRLLQLAWETPTSATESVTWTWSGAGLLQRKEISGYPEGFDYTYDDLERISGVFYNGLEIEGYQYTTAGVPLQRRHEQFGNATYAASTQFHEIPTITSTGQVETLGWDPVTGRLESSFTSTGGAVSRSLTYAYDGAGRLTSRVDVAGAVVDIVSWNYDVDDHVPYETVLGDAGRGRAVQAEVRP